MQTTSTRSLLLLLSALLTSWLHGVAASACIGCVELDELNFDKTITRFPYAIVKFDVAFPYGDKHEAFAQLSKSAHKVTDELLIATVGIKDYGEMENKALGERYQINDKQFPGIFLFKGNTKDYLKLPSHMDITTPNLLKFVMDNTPLYLGVEGCLKEFNLLSKGYANLKDTEQQAVLAKAEQMSLELSKEKEQAQAKIYATFMRKITEKGYNFVDEETKRLQRLKSGKVSEAKKTELTQRLNILETFRVSKLTKEEL